ncbi:MAG: hypothetical protein JWO19_4548, partial [Bryobacterales bacterium]|nr:hypothetical protein [Bryobacterales bacterium]
LALRQQVAVLKRKRPRPKLSPVDRFPLGRSAADREAGDRGELVSQDFGCIGAGSLADQPLAEPRSPPKSKN